MGEAKCRIYSIPKIVFLYYNNNNLSTLRKCFMVHKVALDTHKFNIYRQVYSILTYNWLKKEHISNMKPLASA